MKTHYTVFMSIPYYMFLYGTQALQTTGSMAQNNTIVFRL